MDVVVVGELNVDLILIGLPSLPQMGQVCLAKDMDFTLGSASAILACNLARLGLEVGFVGKLGEDDFGDIILRYLHRARVDTSQIIREKHGRTGICVSMSLPENYAMASYAGIRETFRFEEVNFDYVSRARHLHMSSYYLQPALRPGCPELFRQAKARGMTTSLDPDTDPSGAWDDSIFEVLRYVDVFLPNEYEATHIAGCPDLYSSVNTLRGRAKSVVVKLGSAGALAGDSRGVVRAKGFKVTQVDTTGAGDSFDAGFLHQYLRGSSVWECLVWGNACGAISTTKMGGTTAFPTGDEVERFLKDRAPEVNEIKGALQVI